MFKTACAALVLMMTALVPALAGAGGLKTPQGDLMKKRLLTSPLIEARSQRQAPAAMPPANYQGQWWIHPAGCRYSRAGRPGEVVWFLTSLPKGARCPEFIQQKATDHIYRTPFMIDG